MPIREMISGDLNVIGSSKVTISTDTTTAYDFGTPNDIDLANSNYEPGDRVLVIFTASTAGTTDNLTFVVQDADDNAGSFGTAATAVTTGTLAQTTGDAFVAVSVKVQPGRPWLRCSVDSNGATDTFVTHCLVLGVPRSL